MTDEYTCGRGLAEYALLPKKLADLMAALADSLDVHRAALVIEDDAAKVEHAVYGQLAHEYRSIASRLATLAHHMVSFRDMESAPHHPELLTSTDARDANGRYIAIEREVAALLHSRGA